MCFSYPALSKYFRQKSALILGQSGMVLSLFAIAIFNYLGHNTIMLLWIVLYICFYEFGIGTICFIHIFETNVDSITGLANQVLFFMSFITSLFTPTMINQLTVSGTFVFFGACSLLSLIYILFIVEHTSHYEPNEEGTLELIKLNEKEKKELYWPKEHKVQPILKKIKNTIL